MRKLALLLTLAFVLTPLMEAKKTKSYHPRVKPHKAPKVKKRKPATHRAA